MKGSDLCVDSSVWWRKVAKFHRFAKCKLCWLHTFCEVVNGINGLCGSASLLTRNHALEESEDKPCWGVEEMNEAACIQTCQVFNENPCSQRVWSVWLSKEFRQSSSNIFLKTVFLLFLSGEKKNEKETSFPICFVKNCSIFCVSFWPVFFMLFLHFFKFCNFFSLKKLHFFPKHFLFLFFQKSFSLFFTYFFPNFFQLSSQLFSPTSAWFQGTCFRASSADGRSVASKANIFAQSSASKWVKYAKSVAICFFIQKN